MSDSLPRLTDVADALRQLELATEPAELHGAICGWIAGNGDTGAGWLGKVMADATLPEPARDTALDQLLQVSRAQFENRDFALDLLLADEAETLEERSGSLFDWCRGFLGGFGLAAGDAAALSPESSEALHDLAKLAAAQPQADGDEDDEQALVEIEEFVRVAALLLYGDCVLAARHRQSLH